MKKKYNTDKILRSNSKKKISIKRNKKSFFGALKSSTIDRFNSPFGKKPKPIKKKLPSQSETEYKIFKPKKEYFIKSKIKNSINPIKNKKKSPFSHGNKKLTELSKKVSGFSIKTLPKDIKYQILKYKVAERFNMLMSYMVVLIVSIFTIYISFFDTFFLVKTYTINFVNESYIDDYETDKLFDNIHTDKFLGLLPNNSLWFLNSQNLTYTAQRNNPDINSIKVVDRVWPNKATLEVDLEAILLTLSINDGEYWRINNKGSVVSQDLAGIREKLVVVDKPIIFDKSGTTFRDFSFENYNEQVNRFYYINWLWDLMEEQKIEVSKTEIPSLIDTDVMIYTVSGTKLMFDLNTADKITQKTRFQELFKNDFLKEEKAGSISYIDFRIPKRIYMCRDGEACNN